ncbi:hypothetical protein Ahy_B10g106019 isoform B [Arachis hypogaea]|uniref:EamA domain-containing protein n=1 Tax=Arachis hypogaea TaxID=3818 RepID=A0A444X9I7_ARAHY|nr:hypothetical protein Ahy_B10g106019 isoform B [Arachis hypogaea]
MSDDDLMSASVAGEEEPREGRETLKCRRRDESSNETLVTTLASSEASHSSLFISPFDRHLSLRLLDSVNDDVPEQIPGGSRFSSSTSKERHDYLVLWDLSINNDNIRKSWVVWSWENKIVDARLRRLYWIQTPLQIIHVAANFMRIWSIYSMYRYLTQSGASVVLFLFACIAPAAILFLILQKPWKGRPLSNTQVVPSIINGAITALYFVLWGKGLRSCGPVRAILSEYSGAVLGVLSALLYGRRSNLWKKIGGLVAMLASLYLLSEGWATATYSPFYILIQIYFATKISFHLIHKCCKLNWNSPWEDREDSEAQTEQALGLRQMLVPILAGILSALRRVIARRVSIKNQLKRRLHALTIASATCFMFPFAMWDMIIGSPSGDSGKLPFSTWAFLSTIFFGNIVIFYADSIAEERLHMVFSSPRHLTVAGACIIIMENVYKMDFSLIGFTVCCLILGFGMSSLHFQVVVRADMASFEILSLFPCRVMP